MAAPFEKTTQTIIQKGGIQWLMKKAQNTCMKAKNTRLPSCVTTLGSAIIVSGAG